MAASEAASLAGKGSETSAIQQAATNVKGGPSSNFNAGTSIGTSDAGLQGATDDVAYMMRVESDERIERMFEEWTVLTSVLDGREDVWNPSSDTLSTGLLTPRDRIVTPTFDVLQAEKGLRGPHEMIEDVLPVRLCIPGVDEDALVRNVDPIDEDGLGLLILSPLLANLRNAVRPSTKVRCLDLLLHLSHVYLSDEAKLDRVLPYIITLFDDDAIMARVAAVRAVVQLLAGVEMITPSNASTFAEYVIPNLRSLTKDNSSLVRATFASCLHDLTIVGTKYLQMTSAMGTIGVFSAVSGGATHTQDESHDDFLDEGDGKLEHEGNYDGQADVLRSFFQEQVLLLLTDASPMVKRSLLRHIGPLCRYLGSAMSNDVILSHMITFLNDRSWQLRKAFFDAIVDVAHVVGSRSVEDYILTLLLQALSDPEEFVVLHVLQSLGRLLDSGLTEKALLSTGKVLDVMAAIIGFLCHPNYWLRCAAACVVEIGGKQLSEAEAWAILYPSLRPLLRCDIENITAAQLLFAAKAPLSREILQKAVQWALRAKNSKFWKASAVNDSKSRFGLSNGLGREGVSLMMVGQSFYRTPISRNEEDDAHFDSLRSSGLGEHEEVKLIALREYITKLAKVTSVIGSGSKTIGGLASTVNQEDANILPPLQIKSNLAVQPLEDVTPLTIFFGPAPTRSTRTKSAAPDTASVRSHAASSTFSGRLAKKRLGGVRTTSDMSITSPLEDLRRRMMQDVSEVIALPISGTTSPPPTQKDDSEDQASAKSHAGRGAGGAGAHGVLDFGKAQPAVASDTTTATGTMVEGSARIKGRERNASNTATIESGRTSPAAGTANDEKQSAPGGPGEAANEGAVFTSTYDGNDPYIRAHLEAVYVANFQDRQVSWGPVITGVATKKRLGGVGVRAATAGARAVSLGSGAGSSSGLASNRRPEGNMIAYFTEHAAAITSIVVSPDHAFFVSGAEDGKIKVWDTARLEKNVTSRSRATYGAQRGKIVCLVMLEGSHCVASAAMDGSVHILRVETSSGGVGTSSSSLPKYGKLRLVSNFQLSDPSEYVVCMAQSVRRTGISTREAALVAGSNVTSSSARGQGVPQTSGHTLILATSKGHLIILDLRTMQVLTNYENPSHFGAITAMCVDPKNIWLLVATVGGSMCLWDLRFHLLVKTWRLATLESLLTERAKSTAVQEDDQLLFDMPTIRVNSVVQHPSKGNGKWVMIAFEKLNTDFQGQSNGTRVHGRIECLVETWDIETASCVEIFTTVRHETLSTQRDDDKVRRSSAAGLAEHDSRGSIVNLYDTEQQPGKRLDARFDGLSTAAEAIERLVRLQEARMESPAAHRDTMSVAAKEDKIESEAAAASEQSRQEQLRYFKGKEVIPPSAPTSFVRAMLVGTTGYATGSLPHAAQVSGGWLDAGKLASANADENGIDPSDSSARPAGYLIIAGMDRRIRFWDLGKVEKSVAFGAVTDEKHEFNVRAVTSVRGKDDDGARRGAEDQNTLAKAVPPALSSQALQYTHHVRPTPATTRAAAASLRSPLLTHHSSSSTTSMLLKAHKDAITALALIELPFRCIVAGDYAGNIRVWE
jgi:phosphoinositide-3-kinase regulatory subunit 4